MFRFVVLLPFCLAACAIRGSVSQTPAAADPPMAQHQPIPAPSLQGRWTITELNGKRVAGLWLELGGEGLVTITDVGNAVYVRSPQPQTRAYLGCNWWDASGWTRSGDTLILGREASRMTERGCDDAVQALEEEAYTLLTKPMTVAFTTPDQLRLVNESGALRLIR